MDLKIGKPGTAIELSARATGIVTDGQGAAYVTLQETDEVAVIDTQTMSLLTKWAMGGAHAYDGNLNGRKKRPPVRGMPKHAHGSLVDRRRSRNRQRRPGKNDGGKHRLLQRQSFRDDQRRNLLVVGQTKDGKYEVQQRIALGEGASTLAVDGKTGALYIPTIDFDGPHHPVKDSFKVLVLEKK